MFHREGYQIILLATIILLALNFLTVSYAGETTQRITLILSLIIFVLILQFFRNPKRDFKLHDDHILSPVDGKVVVIEKVFVKEYFNAERIQVSVFMSPVNIHVTRYPIGGKVVYSQYHPGKYLVAWHPKSSEANERTTVVINHDNHGEIMYRQIAGAMAKRIVNYASVDDLVFQGADSGFIKFGSRVDMFLPLDAEINASLHQKVKGGISLIATLNDSRGIEHTI